LGRWAATSGQLNVKEMFKFQSIHPELDEGFYQILLCPVCGYEFQVDATDETNLVYMGDRGLIPQCPECSFMEDDYCIICGKDYDHEQQEIEFNVRGETIVLSNVPVKICNVCGISEEEYGIDLSQIAFDEYYKRTGIRIY